MTTEAREIEAILDRHPKAVQALRNDRDFSDELYHDLYEYFTSNNEMPYGTAKARTGDPYQWIFNRIEPYL